LEISENLLKIYGNDFEIRINNFKEIINNENIKNQSTIDIISILENIINLISKENKKQKEKKF